MNKPDAGSGALSFLAALSILMILVMLSRTSEAVSLLDGRILALEGRKGSALSGPGGTSAGSVSAAEEALHAELAAIERDLEHATATQNTLGFAADPLDSPGSTHLPGTDPSPLPRTYAALVKTIQANLVERDHVRHLEYARKMVESHVKLATFYSDKLGVGLNLQPEQKEKILEIVRDQVRAYEPILALEVIDEAALAEVAEIDRKTDQRIIAELKPEQTAKYEDIKRPWLQALVHRAGNR